jgi:Uma2 family endonuclease
MSTQIAKPLPESLKYTYEDYKLLPDDRNRYEIIDGELYLTPSPITAHQRISIKLALELETFGSKYKLGKVFYAPFDVILSRHDVVQPDLLFVSQKRQAIITEKNIQGAPDLVIEIISPETKGRDLGLKKKLYAKSGAQEYWIVYHQEKKVELYALSKNQYLLSSTFTQTDSLKSKLLRGFEIDLAHIFTE